jgi:hypothetical protein
VGFGSYKGRGGGESLISEGRVNRFLLTPLELRGVGGCCARGEASLSSDWGLRGFR